MPLSEKRVREIVASAAHSGEARVLAAETLALRQQNAALRALVKEILDEYVVTASAANNIEGRLAAIEEVE